MPARFIGTVSVTWLTQNGEDRDMLLNQEFGFEDAAGLVWTAVKDAVINGASIPKIFWTSFGCPFIGDYRNASVIHDYFCGVRTRPSAATHHMFYEACRAGGVGEFRAKTMYTMVKTFGPSWTTLNRDLDINGVVVLKKGRKATFTHAMSDTDFAEITKWIERDNPSIAAIDAEIERRSIEMLALPQGADAVSSDGL